MNDGKQARDVVVGQASRGDLAQVAELFDAYRMFYRRASDLAAARAFLEERRTRAESVILVARLESEERLAGFAQLYPTFSSVSLAPLVVLNDLFVAPHARRHGVGAALVDASAAHARERGAVQLELSTATTNDAARRLYLAKGFIEDKEFSHMSLTLR